MLDNIMRDHKKNKSVSKSCPKSQKMIRLLKIRQNKKPRKALILRDFHDKLLTGIEPVTSSLPTEYCPFKGVL